METEKQNLDARTRQRNALTWLTLDLNGVMAPLANMEADLDNLALPGVENFMAISDENWGIKEAQMVRTVELGQAEVDQDREIAAAKAVAARAKIAIEKATDEYTLSVKVYESLVRGLLMGAREFAALVELESLAADAARAAVEVEKEGVRQEKINVQIQIEAIEAAQADLDIAKAKVEVAKAHVRAAIAGIEASKAELEVIETQVQVAMAEAERATLEADVAMIYAEIVTKQLTDIKLGVGQAEIAAGYEIIATKLSDAIALYDSRALTEEIKRQAEALVLAEHLSYRAAKETEANLRTAEAAVAQAVEAYEAGALSGERSAEEALRQGLVDARKVLADAVLAMKLQRDSAQTDAQELINSAMKATYKLSESWATSLTRSTEYISG